MRIHKFSRYLIVFIMACILLSLSALVPFENAFVTFSSPESAYRYIYMNKAELVVEGTNTALVYGREGNDCSYTIMVKSDNGWKLGVPLDIKTNTSESLSYDFTTYVDQYKDSGEYYITIFIRDGAAAAVTDNRNSKFYCLNQFSNGDDKSLYSYHAYVHDLDDKYVLIVNGEEIPVVYK